MRARAWMQRLISARWPSAAAADRAGRAARLCAGRYRPRLPRSTSRGRRAAARARRGPWSPSRLPQAPHPSSAGARRSPAFPAVTSPGQGSCAQLCLLPARPVSEPGQGQSLADAAPAPEELAGSWTRPSQIQQPPQPRVHYNTTRHRHWVVTRTLLLCPQGAPRDPPAPPREPSAGDAAGGIAAQL